MYLHTRYLASKQRHGISKFQREEPNLQENMRRGEPHKAQYSGWVHGLRDKPEWYGLEDKAVVAGLSWTSVRARIRSHPPVELAIRHLGL